MRYASADVARGGRGGDRAPVPGSGAPPPSLGTVDGVDVEAQAVIDDGFIFGDGFESGDTNAWSGE
ncbi:MAG: hypothetical protein GY842_27090 [bacterium]|nr:hypothetical protein [bacterium]